MACDLTRVFSYEWSATQSEAVYWEVSSSTEHHELSHNASTGTEMKNVVKFIMKNFAYLAQKLYEQGKNAKSQNSGEMPREPESAAGKVCSTE